MGRLSFIVFVVISVFLFLFLTLNLEAKPLSQGVGLNKFDLELQYLGEGSGGAGQPEYVKIEQLMGKKAIIDASNMGANFLRVSVTGYGPSTFNSKGDLNVWVDQPAKYWSSIDLMISDLKNSGLQLSPVFMWNWTQFPSLTSETLRDLITNPNSNSYKLLTKYVTDFIKRYKDRDVINFYELTNELNLGADLDLAKRCQTEQHNTMCGPQGNFSTDEMTSFIDRFAGLVKILDPSRSISSGFGLPRQGAQHMRAQPEWSAKGPDWTEDSEQQFQDYILFTHRSLDIISAHYYPDDNKGRFNLNGIDYLSLINKIATSHGKKLFIGEYGDANPYLRQDPQKAMFGRQLLQNIVKLKIAFSSPWIFEFYQFSLTDSDLFSIEPGITDPFISEFKNAAIIVNKWHPQIDTPNLQILITWPLDGANVDGTQPVHVVASADQTGITQVELTIDGKSAGIMSQSPYDFKNILKNLTKGNHRIMATATDSRGYTSHDQLAVSFP